LLNVAGYYDPMLAMIDRANEEKFLCPSHRELVLVAANIGELLALMARYKAPRSLEKWIDRASA
jgi:predicted Rossmann-fold nucleotide-binding protein